MGNFVPMAERGVREISGWYRFCCNSSTMTYKSNLLLGTSLTVCLSVGCLNQSNESSSQMYSSALSSTTSLVATHTTAAVNVDGVSNEWPVENDQTIFVHRTVQGTVTDDADASATVQAMWNKTHLFVLVRVQDDVSIIENKALWADDSIELYIDSGNEKSASYDANDYQVIVRADGAFAYGARSATISGFEHAVTRNQQGYVVEMSIPIQSLGIQGESGNYIGFDVGIDDDDDGGARDGQRMWSGTADNWKDPSSWGQLEFQAPSVLMAQSTTVAPTINGDGDEWTTQAVYTIGAGRVVNGIVNDDSDASATVQAMWDRANLYLFVRVSDDSVITDDNAIWANDSVEIYLNGGGEKTASYDLNDYQLVVQADGVFAQGANSANISGFRSATGLRQDGYSVEMAIPLAALGVSGVPGTTAGFDVGINDDDDGGARDGQLMWKGTVDNWQTPSGFGSIELSGPALDDPGTPDAKSNSPIGTNLAAVHYYSHQIPLVDAFKMSAEWVSGSGSTWNDGRSIDVNQDGWIRSLLPDQVVRTLMFVAHHYPAGQYVVLYDGVGTLRFRYDAVLDNLASIPGRAVLNVDTPTKKGIMLEILDTDPADPIRNIRVIRPGGSCQEDVRKYCETDSECGGDRCVSFEESYQKRPFHPSFLKSLENYSMLRFMDWMRTNGSQQQVWSERPKVTDARYSTNKGMPLELMIDLCNTLGVDPWFTLPHLADNDYIYNFALAVAARIHLNLKVYVEHSNEVWNGIFAQAKYARQRGVELGLSTNDRDAGLKYHSRRSVEIFRIFEKAFSSRPEQLVRVMGLLPQVHTLRI